MRNTFHGSICAFRRNAPRSNLRGTFTGLCIILLSDSSQYPHLNMQTQSNQTCQAKGKKCWHIWKTPSSGWGYRIFWRECHEHQSIAGDLIANSSYRTAGWQNVPSHTLFTPTRSSTQDTCGSNRMFSNETKLGKKCRWATPVNEFFLCRLLLLTVAVTTAGEPTFRNKHLIFQDRLAEQTLPHFISVAKGCSLK